MKAHNTAMKKIQAGKRRGKIALIAAAAACALALIVTVALTLAPAWTESSAEIPVGLSITFPQGVDPENRYLSGTAAVFDLNVSITGLLADNTYEDPILTLSYNVDDILTSTSTQALSITQKRAIMFTGNTSSGFVPTISDAPILLRKQPMANNNEGSNYGTVTWELNDLEGGTSFSLPGHVIMPDNITPIGYPLVLNATLTSKNQVTLTYSIPIYWTLNQLEITMKRIVGQGQVTQNRTTNPWRYDEVFGGSTLTTPGFIDASGTYPVKFRFIDPFIEGYSSNQTSIQVSSDNYASIKGVRSIIKSKIHIVDYLPPEATFDLAENPGWDYDPVAHTATYLTTGATNTTNVDVGYPTTRYATLTLRFPNAQTQTKITNTFDRIYYTENPMCEDPEFFTLRNSCDIYLRDTDMLPFGMFNKRYANGGGSFSSGTDSDPNYGNWIGRYNVKSNIQGDYWWSALFNNTSLATEYSNVVIEDYELYLGMKFTRFFLGGPVDASDMKVEYRDAADGEWYIYGTYTAADLIYSQIGTGTDTTGPIKKLTEDERYYISSFLSSGTLPKFSDMFLLPADVTVDGLRLTATGPIKPGEQYKIHMSSAWRGQTEADAAFAAPVDTTTKFYNRIKCIIDGQELGKISTHYRKVVYQPTLFAANSPNDAALSSTYYVNDTINLETYLGIRNLDQRDTFNADDGQLLYFLPPGIEYVPGSSKFTSQAATYLPRLVSLEPEIIHDYKGTGMTALIWRTTGKIPAVVGETDMPILRYFSFSVKVLETANVGKNTITSWWMVSDEQNYPRGFTSGTVSSSLERWPYNATTEQIANRRDVLDLDNDGDTTEQFLRRDMDIIYAPPKAMVAIKGVKSALSSTFLYEPGRAYAFAGTNAEYKVTAINYSDNPVTKLRLIDVLPYNEDKALVADGTGAYAERESEFPVTLRGPLEIADARFTVFYTTTEIPGTWNGIAAFESAASWVAEGSIGDWSKVTGFKLELASGSLAPGEKVDIVVNAKISSTAKPEEMAFNSVAISSATGTDPYGPWLEAIRAGIEIIGYDVGIEKTADKAVYDPGETVEYTVTVTNTQKSLDATLAKVIDVIPAELDFEDCSLPHTYNSSTRELEVTLGTIKPKQSVTFTITCKVKASADPGATITNTAIVEIKEDETTYENNTDSCDINVKGASAALRISKVVDDPTDTEAFTFIVKDSQGNPVDLTGEDITVTKTDGDGTLDTNPADLAEGKFTLTHDTTVTIDGLAPGGYQVTEEALGYTITYTVDGSAESGLAWDTATANTGKISPNETLPLVFINSISGEYFPKTGGIGEKILYGLAVAAIIGTAAGTVMFTRRRRQRRLYSLE